MRMVVVVAVMMVMRQWRRAERGGCEARGGRGRGGIKIKVELVGRRQDEMEPSLGEMGVGGGACDTASGGRYSAAAADLGGAGQVLAEDRGVVVRSLFQLKQRQ